MQQLVSQQFMNTEAIAEHSASYIYTIQFNTIDFLYERVMVRNALFRRRVEKGTNLARFLGQL